MSSNETMSDFQKEYRETIAGAIKSQLGYANPMQVPRLLKITVNMGLGEAARDKGSMESALSDMEKITGQKPVVTRAKKAVAGFGIREDWLIGCKVTLRGVRMYEFMERLIKIVIPRIRDFRGFSGKSFDGRGNYSLGISEQIVFPEIDYDNISQIRGLDIAITTNAASDEGARALLEGFKFPFQS